MKEIIIQVYRNDIIAIIEYFPVLIFSIWGGIISYILDKERSKQAKSVIKHIIIASFTGSVVAFICFEAELTYSRIIIVASISSTIGLQLIKFAQRKVLAMFKDKN